MEGVIRNLAVVESPIPPEMTHGDAGECEGSSAAFTGPNGGRYFESPS